MALPVWGNLTKSPIDPEKIEEAIARLIQAHEDDPNAHIEAGESLQSHKAAAIIDHVVASIVADKIKKEEVIVEKLAWDKILITSEFESLDGWHKGGIGAYTMTVVLGGTKIRTGNNDGDTAYIACVPPLGMGENPNFDNKPSMQVRVAVMDNDFAEGHIHIGFPGFQVTNEDYIGFKLIGGNIYAVCRAGGANETSVDITGGLYSGSFHDYKVVWNSINNVEFYIDGVLKTTITTNIPYGDNQEAAIFIGVRNYNDGGGQSLGVLRAIYQEDI